MARNFKKLEVWELGYNLSLDFYKITEKFPEHEVNNLISQIRRASTSVPLNIAEGCSRHTKNSFLQFLRYAYGSCKELEVLLMLSRDLKYIDLDIYSEMNSELDKLSRKLYVFIEKIDKEGFRN
jgi:four helix bundle protein